MRRLHVASLLLSILVGCSDPSAGPTVTAGTYGPHGGPLVELPGNSGFVEIVAEPLPNPKAGGDGVLAVYALTPDLKGALSPAPTGVSLSIRTPGADTPTKVELTPQAKPKEPFSAARLASKPGQFLIDQLSGEITLTAGGETRTSPFAFPR